ncbi:MAG TPA: hypothetical protein VIJ95_11920, partial [Hanamia sp.]
MQFDKPYYAAGDTIYFKAYVTEGEQHQLSELSGVLHVDFIDTENKIEQSLKLQLDSGLAWGDFALPDSLPPGNYRVRAYTQLMLNNGQSEFFDLIIPVASLKEIHLSANLNNEPLKDVEDKVDLQFFPEGGKLVTGIRSKVGFKAIDANGLGFNIKGVILDNNNQQVCSFSSSHLGMGYFFLSPEEGKTYQAKVDFGDGTKKIIDLPIAEASGITLSVGNQSISKVSFTIQTNDAFIPSNRHKNFLLLIYSGGKTITYTLKLEAQTITLDMQKRLLKTGVNKITLFSENGVPLCERLFFVQNNDLISLQLDTAKAEYKKREKVSLLLNAKDPTDSTVAGHFSVSVTDESKVPEDVNNEHTILTNLLLTSELMGYVEQPNYYFNDTSENARDNLDALMLTQGYRLFEWKQVMDTNYTPLVYQPEKALEISGKITNLTGKPLANGTVNLIPTQGGSVLSSVSDSIGVFHFSNIAFTDTTHFELSAVNSRGKNYTKIIYFNDNIEPEVSVNPRLASHIVNDSVMSVYLENAKSVREEDIKYGNGKAIVLKEVKVKAKNQDDQYRTQSLAGAGHADQVMHADEIERVGGQLSTSLNGRLHGIGFFQNAPYLTPFDTGPMIVVLDGSVANLRNKTGKIEPYDVNVIPSSQIETIEVLKNASASMYGMEGGNGVLVITTKRGDEMSDNIASVGVLSIAPMGFYKARKFYSPKYDYT